MQLWAWEVINGVVQIGFDLLVLRVLGGRALAYLLLGTALGLGCHPLSGHFISEHYLFQTSDHQATHSYYGPLNGIMFNLGYHVEHHGTPLCMYSTWSLARAPLLMPPSSCTPCCPPSDALLPCPWSWP